jgi:hypothetical protein
MNPALLILLLFLAFLCGCLFTATVAAMAAMVRHTAPRQQGDE